ncbi:hypothetical protein GCM10009527_039480 [Actinomadura nitritigenes]|uniref:alpha/beta fold hydrolase n=1 Tax=Actinomadura nitritigenes TaxID=134602 RepID=UPI001FB67156|nr:alpha/beta hydrolase [Actinomadura nitritigenes]
MTDTVHMWHAEHGTGSPVVLLHGGMTDGRCFTGNLDGLADAFRVYRPDRRGHGRTPDAPGPITIDVMARDTIAFLDRVVGGPARLVGYSAGGSVALRAAILRPDLVERLVLISTAYDVDGMIFKPSADGPMPPPIVDAYAEVSPDGRDHFPVVVRKIADAAATEPAPDPSDLRAVTARTLVLAGRRRPRHARPHDRALPGAAHRRTGHRAQRQPPAVDGAPRNGARHGPDLPGHRPRPDLHAHLPRRP